MVNCTINGKPVSMKEGSTIIQAFKELNEDICHYCWHPALSIAGVCRLCMVEIEGNPKLQIACNTTIAEGMKISNQSEKVKDAVKWGLDFHLINHPLDCPICDQAGECGLQDQYMQFGKYDPEMAERKVKKRKVVDLGERVVLDSERCILCSRCVRFTEEISKTNELGIFNRGDHSEIGTFKDKPLNNNYSVNTVDICPVGALTSKDFRFKQRVWFLKDQPSVCTGCSTGCNVDVYFNKEGTWRMKPRFNPDVNGYWMCDVGRDMYKHTNLFHTEVTGERGQKSVTKNLSRLTLASSAVNGQKEFMDVAFAVQKLRDTLSSAKEAALVVTAQNTVEELDAMVGYFVKKFGPQHIYHWSNSPGTDEGFDGLLYRPGDKNPNTAGLKKVFEKHGVKSQPWKAEGSKYKTTVVVAPETVMTYPDFAQRILSLKDMSTVIWLGSTDSENFEELKGETWLIPTKTFVEKSGTFINYKGLEQKIRPVTLIVPNAMGVDDIAAVWAGQAPNSEAVPYDPTDRVENEFVYHRGSL